MTLFGWLQESATVEEWLDVSVFLHVMSNGARRGTTLISFLKVFLWDRGCTIERGYRHFIRTPAGVEYVLYMWNGTNGHLPYIVKDQLDEILIELWTTSVPFRTAHQTTPTALTISRAGAVIG